MRLEWAKNKSKNMGQCVLLSDPDLQDNGPKVSYSGKKGEMLQKTLTFMLTVNFHLCTVGCCPTLSAANTLRYLHLCHIKDKIYPITDIGVQLLNCISEKENIQRSISYLYLDEIAVLGTKILFRRRLSDYVSSSLYSILHPSISHLSYIPSSWIIGMTS